MRPRIFAYPVVVVLLASGLAITGASAGHAAPVAGACTTQFAKGSGPWQTAGPDLQLTQGDRLRFIVTYSHGDGGSPPFHPADFTTTVFRSMFFGATHVIDTKRVWGGDQWSFTTGSVLEYRTDDWINTTDLIDVAIRSDESGGLNLATCHVKLTLLGNDKLDRDGDGLLDVWETRGIDIDHDGVADHLLVGANPDLRDVYVEVDRMDCAVPGSVDCPAFRSHRDGPTVAGVSGVVQAFANAPALQASSAPAVRNPGINLHIDVDEGVPHDKYSSFEGPAADFPWLKHEVRTAGSVCRGYFGTTAERGRLDCKNVLMAKLAVTHYGIYAHERLYPAPRPAGVSDGANDFMIFVETIRRAGGEQAPTLMHELGHDFALGHGGGDKVNCKPNYRSVMNYAWGFDPGRRLDYSREVLPSLYEPELDEPFGLGPGVSGSVVYGGVAGSTEVRPVPGGVDWDDDGIIDPNATSADINFIAAIGGDQGCNFVSPGQLLQGHNDWQNLSLPFRTRVDLRNEWLRHLLTTVVP